MFVDFDATVMRVNSLTNIVSTINKYLEIIRILLTTNNYVLLCILILNLATLKNAIYRYGCKIKCLFGTS